MNRTAAAWLVLADRLEAAGQEGPAASVRSKLAQVLAERHGTDYYRLDDEELSLPLTREEVFWVERLGA